MRANAGMQRMTDPALQEYHGYLRGKSVALVGPAETTRDAAGGGVIDSHDVVVRMNNAYRWAPYGAELARDIGSRTDVLYICPAEVEEMGRDACMQLKRSSCRFVVVWDYLAATEDEARGDPRWAREHGVWTRRGHLREPKRLLEQVAKVQVITINRRYRELLEQVGANPKAGFMALMDLLCSPIERLFVTGMTFMHGGGHLFRTHGVVRPEVNHKGKPTSSNPINEARIVAALRGKYGPRLTVDTTLSAVLNMYEAASA